MSNILPSQIVIENVVQCKMRGKVAYQSHVPAAIALNLTYVKPFDDPSGKGYQRPVDQKRCNDFAIYLSKGEDALFTPILLNAASKWEFSCYDKLRPAFGRLICKGKASLMDGQHRLGGIKRYIQETNSDINVPFLAFHCLDEDEEIHLFDTINTKAKGIGTSLSKFLRRDSDDLCWMATELLVRPESPFYHIGSIIGKRSKERHITLQNLYRMLHLLIRDSKIEIFSKEEKLLMALTFYNSLKETFTHEWLDYSNYRLTHIVCLDALSIAGSELLASCTNDIKRQFDYNRIHKSVKKLSQMDWSSEGPLKYLKGMNGSKTLSVELQEQLLGK
ncbi:DGQHR domain-containing protein [Paenibacillus chondroitinus]|uniref:DGQHR domain-containing protein n=1 Tax=Paenibacillus chondroitinus TaxID=59842 RepID=A0ABU6DKV4_9BACL|nr:MULTISPECIES: DGQHR domain-containing protein [Paenibacillus]MCY9657117.1 DGQHR domain-containing protein [Paenibacillus anseongense]MEB4798400.1 DGQHR domain-containing protein [Paenibacillus chondroitinus]